MTDITDHVILVAHDDVETRCELALALRAVGFQTVQADNGRAALKFAEHVSAVLIHVDLPDLSGPEVCRILRSRPETARLPIVQVLKGADQRDALEGEGAGDADGVAGGGNACVWTPFEQRVLQDTFIDLLTRQALSR